MVRTRWDLGSTILGRVEDFLLILFEKMISTLNRWAGPDLASIKNMADTLLYLKWTL
jgi:hypothetical protein